MDPYWQNCPYPDCPIHDHLPVRGEEFNRARWLHHMLPCCRWCEIWQAIAEDMVSRGPYIQQEPQLIL